jgi:peptidyl-prolyl cis-trans isomerase-like protein 2
MLNIIPYVNKNKRCAVTGDTLHLRDLTKLTFHTNEKGEHHCPVMFKTFTPHTHIVANKASGHVYCFEAVETLCYKTKNFKDLMTEVPFTKQDIITLQDPHNFGNREIEAFNHIKMGEETRASKVAEMAVSDETRRILIKAGLAKEGEVGSKRASQATVAPEAKRAKDSEADLKRKTGVSSGAMAASFTSTALDVAYQVEEQVMTEKEQAQEKYKIMRKLGKKGYVQMRTNYGDLNLEVRADWAPMTAENFLTLCSRNYYDGVSFHRLIKNFMVQGGDPTGTGKGGESCWGGKFDDEFDSRLRHEGRGVLSMANSGKNANGSQFFITLKSCPHLNNKHSVFGSVVGGLDILTKIERSSPTHRSFSQIGSSLWFSVARKRKHRSRL